MLISCVKLDLVLYWNKTICLKFIDIALPVSEMFEIVTDYNMMVVMDRAMSQ